VNIPERTPDGHPQLWLLYRSEPWTPTSSAEREMNLWVRRADVFTSRQQAMDHLTSLIGRETVWAPYNPIFPELWVGHDGLGHRWWMAPAPLNPPGGRL
jgi:hypothetical protein